MPDAAWQSPVWCRVSEMFPEVTGAAIVLTTRCGGLFPQPVPCFLPTYLLFSLSDVKQSRRGPRHFTERSGPELPPRMLLLNIYFEICPDLQGARPVP